MDTFFELENGHVTWYDAEQTIAYCHVFGKWNWDDGYSLVKNLNDMVATSPNDVYSIFHLDGPGDMVPPAYAILNLRRMLSLPDPSNEKMTIIITKTAVLKTFLGLVQQLTSVKDKVSTYQYFPSLDGALHHISKVKMADPVPER
jgi:hypothetical protein